MLHGYTLKLPFIKLNFDGSFTIGNKGGIGGIFRDHKGKWIYGFCQAIPAYSVVEAETRTLMSSLLLAEKHGWTSLETETDSHILYNTFLFENYPKIYNFIED